MHLLGFSYYADGAHDDVDELEPGITGPGAQDLSCKVDLQCPAPMYSVDRVIAGTYSNDPNIAPPTTGKGDFGLDTVEFMFFHSPADWKSYGEFSVTLNYPETDGFDGDIFYFCHLHGLM